MKKSLFFSLVLCFLFLSSLGQTELRGVTFGIATGFSKISQNVYSYSLSPESSHLLQLQKNSKLSFVISSVLTIKLGNLGVQQEGNQKEKLVNLNKTDAAKTLAAGGVTRYENPGFFNRLSVNIGINLLEANSENISFNKSIDGGIGIGFFVNEFTQLSIFYDLIRIRQMRDYIVTAYEGKSIPFGNEVYNALDENDNTLFYTKNFTGFSFKVIFSLGNKKE
jgi:hypothetical protein